MGTIEKASHQQKYHEFEPADAKILVYNEDDPEKEGYISGEKLTGVETFTATASNDFTVGTVGYLVAAGTITLADADTQAAVNSLVVMALGTVNGGESGQFQLPYGKKVVVTGHGFTVGLPLYISATAGELTATPPGSGDFVRPVAYALDANTLLFVGAGTTIAGS